MDLFDEESYENVTEHGIRKRYYETFLIAAKAAKLKGLHFWELEEIIPLPACMQQGSQKESVELLEFNTHFDFLCTKRCYNVENHIKIHINGEYGLKPGETVRDIHGQIWF